VSDPGEAAARLHAHGWVVLPGVFAPDQVAALRAAFADALLAVRTPLRRQLTSRDEAHRRDAWGRVRNPIVVHHLGERFPAVGEALTAVLSHPALMDAIVAALGPPALTQATWVHSTDGTALHQDPHPLEPDAPLLGVWVALEDIAADAGPFVVVPGSLDLDPAAPDVVAWRHAARSAFNAQFQEGSDPTGQAGLQASRALQTLLDARGLPVEPVIPAAGDVILWRGDLVHGSHPPGPGPQTRQSLLLHLVERRFAQPPR